MTGQEQQYRVRRKRQLQARKRRRKKQLRRKRCRRLFMAVSMIILIIVLMKGKNLLIPVAEDNGQGDTSEKTASTEDYDQTVNIAADDLHSPYALLLHLESGQVLFEKNSQERCYPASLTKIMTTLLVLEQADSLEEEITLSASVFEQIAGQNASVAGFYQGEQVRIIDLLYGVMLPSGAECSIALAEYISGSEAEFAVRMNARAADLGMYDTRFLNATGLHDENHYTTMADMSTLLAYCLENEQFREIFTSLFHAVPATNMHPDGMTLYSTLTKEHDDFSAGNGMLIGGKTGHTSEAGLCLASLGTAGGEEYILITAGADVTSSESGHIEDALYVYRKVAE